MLYDVYDVYDDSRRYTNATNTPISDIMKEMVPYLFTSSIISVRGVLGGVGAAAQNLPQI